MNRKWRYISIAVTILILAAIAVAAWLLTTHQNSSDTKITQNKTQPNRAEKPPQKNYPTTIKTMATGLDTPWSISFLPDGDMLVSERDGNLNRIGKNGAVYPVKGVREYGEGGLLGIALDPSFGKNHKIYMYYTTDQGGSLTNQVDSATLANGKLSNVKTIIGGIPAAIYHDGGGIAFGPDGKLYITTGDARKPNLAQDKNSLAGKILRINSDGSIPSDNPFGNATWSYGHRNPQGITWDNQGRMWEVEHGPTATGSGQDELNLIEKGANYGWPVITGDETHAGMKSPVAQSGSSTTWAPSRLAFADGKLFFTGLRGQALYEYDLDSKNPEVIPHFQGKYGRLRAIAVHDHCLFIGTSNRDGRGDPHSGDDKIIRIPLSKLQ